MGSSFIEPDSFDNNVLFHNTTPIYLINLLRKLGLRLGLDLKVAIFSHFRGEYGKRAPDIPQISRKITSC